MDKGILQYNIWQKLRFKSKNRDYAARYLIYWLYGYDRPDYKTYHISRNTAQRIEQRIQNLYKQSIDK